MKKLKKNPHKIESMFSSIAHSYDLLNRLLSFGRDRYWRRFAVSQLPVRKDGVFLDLATGTGDVAIEIVKQHSQNIRVKGIDFSKKMLELGKAKILKRGLQEQIEMLHGDITSLPFEDKTFEATIIAFGIRNIPDYKTGVKEMTRVVKEGGKVVILEFTSVQKQLFKWLFQIYLTKFLPFIGGIISGKRDAYKYLSTSVLDFPGPVEFKGIMEDAGLRDVKYFSLTLGIVVVHVGTK